MVRGRGYRDVEVVKLAELAAQGKLGEGVFGAADTLFYWDGYNAPLDPRRRMLRREAFTGLFRGARTVQQKKYVLWRFAKCEGVPYAWDGPTYLDGKDSEALSEIFERTLTRVRDWGMDITIVEDPGDDIRAESAEDRARSTQGARR